MTVLAAGLTACAAGPAVQEADGVGWPAARERLARIEAFVMNGRVAVAADPEGFNGRVEWRQDDEAFDIALRGPLGVGSAALTGDTTGVTLTRSDGRDVFVTDPQGALEEELGWSIPITALRYWLVGLPRPDAPAQETLNEPGTRLARLDQDDWRVEYASYQDAGEWILPRKVTLTRPGVRIRLIADGWQVERARAGP